ncbi:MAG: hypothetical protein H6634_18860 [Anaerolineales bacterium]|nr:hypothetical protein [Anaerolineales bacterium]
MKKLFSLFFAISLTLSACRTVSAQPTPPAQTGTPTVTPTATQTPTTNITPLPTIPTFTPTFDVSSIVTVTPAESAECPAINPNIKLDMSFNISQGNNRDTINSKVLKFLNQGGSPQSVIKNIRSNSNSSIDSKSGERAIEADITGDGVLDLLIAPNLYISESV